MREKEVKSYKWVALKDSAPKNAVLYVLDPRSKEIELYITDKNGNPKPVKSYINIRDYIKLGNNNAIRVEDGQIFVKKYNSGDEFIIVEESTDDYKLRLNIDKIEILDNKQNSLDIDGTGTKYPTVDAVNTKIQELEGQINNLESIYHHFSNSESETINHNLGRYVQVTVLEGTEVFIPNSIEHTPDMNSVTVTFIPATTGLIIIQ